jgi:hypothetical protein
MSEDEWSASSGAGILADSAHALSARTAGRSAGVGTRSALAGNVAAATVLPVRSGSGERRIRKAGSRSQVRGIDRVDR